MVSFNIRPLGASFSGGLLTRVASNPSDVALSCLTTCPAPPSPKRQFHKMAFCIFRTTERPLADDWSVFAEGLIGLYQLGPTIPKEIGHNCT